MKKPSQNLLKLEKYIDHDFELYREMVSNDDVMRYISKTKKGLSLEEAKQRFQEMLDENKQGSELGYFKVYNSKNNFIGDCKIALYQQERSGIEVGYRLQKAYWKQGYGTAICKEAIDRSLSFYPHLDLIAIIDPENDASRAILKKLGFVSYFKGVESELKTEKFILIKQTI